MAVSAATFDAAKIGLMEPPDELLCFGLVHLGHHCCSWYTEMILAAGSNSCANRRAWSLLVQISWYISSASLSMALTLKHFSRRVLAPMGFWGTDLLILDHPRWVVKGATMNTVRTRCAPRAHRGSPNCRPLRRLATLVTQRPTEACAALVGRNNCPYHRDGYGKCLGLRDRGILMV